MNDDLKTFWTTRKHGKETTRSDCKQNVHQHVRLHEMQRKETGEPCKGKAQEDNVKEMRLEAPAP